MDKKFQRTKEDFKCVNCDKAVIGNGYTDHCPFCLYSLHVDINPGDRKAECRGLMKPVKVETISGVNYIHYICEKCGYTHRIKATEEDNMDLLIELNKNM